MAISHAGALPATTPRTRKARLYWLAGGAIAVAVLVAVAIALWPQSETDKARADGKAYGAAVAELSAAQSGEEVRHALEDVHTALVDTREHAGDAVAEQAAAQEDALSRAVDGFVGGATTDDEFSREVYDAQLEVALDDVAQQAHDFRTTGPEVQQAFWQGYDQGVRGE
jgi:gas vesicle protein